MNMITIVGEYTNMKTKSPHRCGECMFEWNVSPDSVKCAESSNGNGCPNCDQKRKSISLETHKIRILHTTFECEQQLKGIHTKIKHTCKKCNESIYISPSRVVNSAPCPNCTKIEKAFHYKKSLPNNIKIIQQYKNTNTKIQHICENGHIWAIKPYTTKQLDNHPNCPTCQKTKMGIERYSGVPTWLYYIFIPSKQVWKVGVSMDRSGGTIGRYKREKFDIEIIQETLFEDGADAWRKEQKIITNNTHLAWKPKSEDKFGG